MLEGPLLPSLLGWLGGWLVTKQPLFWGPRWAPALFALGTHSKEVNHFFGVGTQCRLWFVFSLEQSSVYTAGACPELRTTPLQLPELLHSLRLRYEQPLPYLWIACIQRAKKNMRQHHRNLPV